MFCLELNFMESIAKRSHCYFKILPKSQFLRTPTLDGDKQIPLQKNTVSASHLCTICKLKLTCIQLHTDPSLFQTKTFWGALKCFCDSAFQSLLYCSVLRSRQKCEYIDGISRITPYLYNIYTQNTSPAVFHTSVNRFTTAWSRCVSQSKPALNHAGVNFNLLIIWYLVERGNQCIALIKVWLNF